MLNSLADFDDDPILALEESGELLTGRSSMKDWPNERFFGNGLLALIYKCAQNDDLPQQYEDVARDLQTALDEQEPDIVRARAVLSVANWLKRQQGDVSGHKTWLQSAAELGHPAAINEAVLDELRRAGYKVILVTETEAFPPTIQVDADRLLCRSTFSSELLLDHLSELPDVMEAGAPEWCDSELLGSIQNIILFFVFGIRVLADVRHPSFHLLKGVRTYKDRAKPAEDWAERAAALEDQLFWLDPIWSWLINEYVKRSEGPQFSLEKKRQDLLTQRQIVKLFLKNLRKTTCEDELFFLYSELVDHAQNRVAVPEQEPKATMPANEEDHVVLLKGKVPPASEKMDVEYLKRFDCLAEPLPLTGLPSLGRIREINDALIDEFPWADAVVRQVTRELFARAAHGSRSLSFAPILLVGPPGSGKTRFSQRLGSLLSIETSVINCAGMNDVKTFKGLTRGWASARPSLLIERLVQTQRANHLFLLDELEKMGGQNYDGSPHAALLDLLEPGNARRYSDLYLLAEVDLSHCLFVATANSLEPIPAPLLDRLQPVLFPEPGPEHAPTLIRGVALDLERSWGLPTGTIGLDANQKQILAGLPARQMKRAMVQLLAEQAEHRPGGMLAQ